MAFSVHHGDFYTCCSRDTTGTERISTKSGQTPSKAPSTPEHSDFQALFEFLFFWKRISDILQLQAFWLMQVGGDRCGELLFKAEFHPKINYNSLPLI